MSFHSARLISHDSYNLNYRNKEVFLDFRVIHIEIDRHVSIHWIYIRSIFERMAYEVFFGAFGYGK